MPYGACCSASSNILSTRSSPSAFTQSMLLGARTGSSHPCARHALLYGVKTL